MTEADSVQLAESQAMGISGYSANDGFSIYKKSVNNTPINTTIEDGKTGSKVNMTEFRNFLITLLQDNPKGMTIKVTSSILFLTWNIITIMILVITLLFMRLKSCCRRWRKQL